MKKFTAAALTALLFTAVPTFANTDTNADKMTNETLLECANASNARNAIPEHRAVFRHYLMSERGYSFSQLSSTETEFKAQDNNDSEIDHKCRKVLMPKGKQDAHH